MNDYRILLSQSFNIASLQNGTGFKTETSEDVQKRAELEFIKYMKDKKSGNR